MDTLGIEPRAFRTQNGSDTTTPCARHRVPHRRFACCMLGSPPGGATQAAPRGFESLRAEPNGFRVHLLNRSDTVSVANTEAAPHSRRRTRQRQRARATRDGNTLAATSQGNRRSLNARVHTMAEGNYNARAHALAARPTPTRVKRRNASLHPFVDCAATREDSRMAREPTAKTRRATL